MVYYVNNELPAHVCNAIFIVVDGRIGGMVEQRGEDIIGWRREKGRRGGNDRKKVDIAGLGRPRWDCRIERRCRNWEMKEWRAWTDGRGA